MSTKPSPTSRVIGPIIGLFSLGLVILFAELATRVLQPQVLTRPCGTIDSNVGYKYLPNCSYLDTQSLPYFSYSVRTNNFGARMSSDIDDGVPSIVFVGDSFTFGWGLEEPESYFSRLSTVLKEGPKLIQTINAGVPSDSSGRVYKRLKMLSDKFQVTDALYFFNPNDLDDNINQSTKYQPFVPKLRQDGEIYFEDQQLHSRTMRLLYAHTPYAWLNQNSHFFVGLKSLMKKQTKAENNPLISPKLLSLPASDHITSYLISLAHLRKLSNLAKERKFKLWIVWLPLPPFQQREFLRTARSNYSRFISLATECLKGSHVRILNPLPFIAEHASAADGNIDSLFYGEGHLNEVGHFFVAKAVADSFKFGTDGEVQTAQTRTTTPSFCLKRVALKETF